MENVKQNIIAEKSFDFALQIIELYRKLLKQNEFVLSKQIMRSGTSIGANIEEAIGGHSKKDFIARMIIAHKECRETRYWLRLLERSKMVEFDSAVYLKQIEDIFNILTAIINTSKRNLGIPLRIYFFIFSFAVSFINKHQIA
jgi:four helix bundle protein